MSERRVKRPGDKCYGRWFGSSGDTAKHHGPRTVADTIQEESKGDCYWSGEGSSECRCPVCDQVIYVETDGNGGVFNYNRNRTLHAHQAVPEGTRRSI